MTDIQTWKDTPAWKQRILIAREIAAQGEGGRVQKRESQTSKALHQGSDAGGAKSGKSDFRGSAPGGRHGAV